MDTLEGRSLILRGAELSASQRHAYGELLQYTVHEVLIEVP